MSGYPVQREHLVRQTTFREYVARQLEPMLPRGPALAAPQAAELHERLQELEEQVRRELLPGDELWEWSSTGSPNLDWADLDKPTMWSGLAIRRDDEIVRVWVVLSG